MRDLIVVSSVVMLLPVAVMRPQIGILVWFWLGLMNPHRLTYSWAYDFPLATLAAAATLLGLVIQRERRSVPVDTVTIAMVLIGVWVSITTLSALVPDSAFAKWNQSMKILLMTFVTIAVMNSQARLHALILVLVASLGYYGVRGGLFTALTGGSMRVWGPMDTFIGDNNAIGLALLMALPFTRYLQTQAGDVRLRWVLGALMILLVLAIIGTQSRGAFVGLCATAAWFVWRSRYRIQVSLAVLFLGFAALSFVPQSWVDRMRSIKEYEQDQSAIERLQAWEYAFDLSLERPVLGGGFHSWQDEDRFLRHVPEAEKARAYHSIYFEVLGDHGYVGLALFAGFFAACWLKCSSMIRRARRHPDLDRFRELAAMAQVSLVAFGVAGAFQNLAFFDLIYLVTAIIVIADRCLRTAMADAAASGPARGAAADGPGTGRRIGLATAGMAVLACLLPGPQQALAGGLDRFTVPPGQWLELPGTAATSVLVPRSRAPLDGATGGSARALDIYNGAAWDGGRYWYFHGGGHNDYSGNEVYRFDLERLGWERLTEPTALREDPADPNCPTVLPVDVAGRPADPDAPRSTHSYDGLEVIGGRLLVAGSYGFRWCPVEATYSFDPATSDWRRLPGARTWSGEAKSAFDPVTGRWIIAGTTDIVAIDPATGEETPIVRRHSWLASGSAILLDDRREVAIVSPEGLRALDLRTGSLRNILVPLPGYLAAYGGMAYRKGLIWFWSGDARMHTIDPASGAVRDHSVMGDAPETGHVFSRFLHLPDRDLFLALPRGDGNIWAYRPDDRAPGREPNSVSPAALVAAARPGDMVIIPPGTYFEPLVITADGVTVKAREPGTAVFLHAMAESKATILVKASGVMLEGLTVGRVPTVGNGACVRFNEGGRDLTIRGMDCSGAEMGVLVNGDRGVLTIEASRFHGIGRPGSDLGHAVYVACHGGGCPDRAVIRDSHFSDGRNSGHFIKSRARETVIVANTIDGTGSSYSRLVDIPNGGRVTVRDNALIHDASGNWEAIALSMERDGPEGPEHPGSRAEIIGNRIRNSHPRGVLLKTRMDGPVVLRANTQVGLRDWIDDDRPGRRNPPVLIDPPDSLGR